MIQFQKFDKKTIIILLSVICCYSLFSNTYTGNDPEWKLEKNKKGVVVYTRTIPGSFYKEFKGVTTIKCSMSTIMAVFRDIPGFTEWMHDCIESTNLKKISDMENYGYYLYHAPWPVSNRDIVTHSTVKQDPTSKVLTIQMEGTPTFVPSKSDIVRVSKLNGFWKFTPKANGEIEMIYQVHSELGGSVPVWLANSTVVDNPYYTLINFTEINWRLIMN